MSEDGFHHRPSWDGIVDHDHDSDLGHGPTSARNGNGNGNGPNGRMPHYVPSSESLRHQLHPTQQMFDEHSGAPATPTKKSTSTSPPRRSSVESVPLASASGSGSGRWADAGPMAGIGAAGGVGMGMGMAMGTQSELGHGYARPRASLDSERGGGAMSGGEDDEREMAASAADMATLVEPSFDENILRALCETDEAAAFLKKRAALEDEYGKQMQKLARSSSAEYAAADGKAGSFVTAWHASMRTHELMADSRMKFATRLNEMSEELNNLVKEVDKSRKLTKELATRYERALQESESLTEKTKARFDMTGEELERLLLQKEGESLKDNAMQGRSPVNGKRVIGKAVAKGGMLLKGRNPQNIQRQEDDIRARMSSASDAYRKAVTDTQTIRQEYFNFQLPRILRALKECVDEIDLGTQYHLSRYAFLCESMVHGEAIILQPPEDSVLGLKATMESIDNRTDFKIWMHSYAIAHGGANNRGPRRNGPQDEGFLPPIPAHHPGSSPSIAHAHLLDRGRPTFGLNLAEQMTRDDVDVPPIVIKCCEVIEKYGLDQQGIYRVGGTHSKVMKLKTQLDRDLDSVNLEADEWTSDISNVTSVLKLWLRELPDPLFTMSQHADFMEAARNENERARHIRLHERVNALPDPNYSTLKYLMGHLHRVVQHEALNQMSVQNLAIVFGPTLFGQVQPGLNGAMNGMADASLQNKAVETILEHYTDIFVDEGEEQ
ncbi:transporter [Ganoderma sinense ZZ0214-1]|uniref:Transporter n=1 Tax=Ganoderma sinense ZZ0214-1 TaxID=1077348 RepID=A0A2G8RVE0_9APHY|nr:transporter [Ganoderma sinense ZZ0214-1]